MKKEYNTRKAIEESKKKRIGETNLAHNGQMMTIIRYGSATDIDVQFEDGTIVTNKRYYSFQKGHIENTGLSNRITKVGETSFSNDGQKMTIIRYGNAIDIDVEFEDGTVVKNKTYYNFIKGRIKNINHRIGETSLAHNGQKMTIIGCRTTADIDVQFEDGTIVKNKTYHSFKCGGIRNPNFRKRDKN